jgi:hypothetical protein
VLLGSTSQTVLQLATGPVAVVRARSAGPGHAATRPPASTTATNNSIARLAVDGERLHIL